MSKIKRILATILSLFLLLTFTGCKERIQLKGNLSKFETEEKMIEHLIGVWEIDDNYYVFSKNGVVEILEEDIRLIVEDYFDSVVIDGEIDLDSIDAKSAFDYVEKKRKGKWDTEIIYNVSESSIMLNVGLLYITDKGLEDDKGNIYIKISDKPKIDETLFPNLLENAKANYEIPLDKAILSNKQLETKLKEYYPDINNLILVSEENGIHVYTSSGSVDSSTYSMAYIYSDKQIMFSKKTGGKQFVYNYQDNEVMVGDDICSKDLIDVLSEALLFVSKYSKALSAEELLDKFEKESSVKYGAKSYDKTIDGIQYKIVTSTYDGSRRIIVKIV